MMISKREFAFTILQRSMEPEHFPGARASYTSKAVHVPSYTITHVLT